MNLKIICIVSLLVAHSSSMPITKTVVDNPMILPKLTIPNSFVTEPVNAVKNLDSVPNSLIRNAVRPGLLVNSYSIEITPNIQSGTFKGSVLIQARITDPSTNEDEIIFHINRLSITSVKFSLGGGPNYIDADFKEKEDDDEMTLKIDTDRVGELYNFIIEYTGSLDMVGKGLYRGSYDGDNVNYLAMNLHPIYARNVFPCIDEPSEETTITFTFKDMPFDNIVANSGLDNNEGQFKGMQGPPHLWGMVAHSFSNLAVPTTNVLLYGRSVVNQDSQASLAINYYYSALNEWTNKPYLEIDRNQDGRMLVFALPDTDSTWNALSTVGIWEPYILMETTPAVKQRATALVKIAEAMARQWFGYVISPENWRHQWVLSGLATYAAYDVVNSFQTNALDSDVTLIDVNTLFVTEVIQESLLLDSFPNAQVLLPADDIFAEKDIRRQINGLTDLKAPAILRMLRLVLGGKDDDFVKLAAASLLNSRALKAINTQGFYDSLNSYWEFNGKTLISEIAEFLEPNLSKNGYPVVNVAKRQGGVILIQEHFSFSTSQSRNSDHAIPITYTTSVSPDFDDVYPSLLLDGTLNQYEELDDDDWILFNIQGQGYYRVNYDGDLWQRIIDALEDADRREEIHPLNRATLVDDALNLARADRIDYDIAFKVVLSMEHETEYAVWKAFVRNMEFLRKRLTAYILDDEDLDQEIYLKMIRRTITKFENEITFKPDPMILEPVMVSKTRGMVMEHACKAGYESCVAAAVDWFYDPNNADVVNPDIPRDIRPAVYCTMVREGGSDNVQLLYDRLALEASQYERIVILEALACSQDETFINTLLEETIASNSPHNTEERCKIFKAIAESSYDNAQRARNFMTRRTNEIRNKYGGPEKLEEMIFALVDNMADNSLTSDFRIWINTIDSNLDDSLDAAKKARDMAEVNLDWVKRELVNVYEWIEENDAPTLMTSLFLLTISVAVALFNN